MNIKQLKKWGALLAFKVMKSPSEKFVDWKNAKQESPIASGDYLCYVKEITDFDVVFFYQNLLFYSLHQNKWVIRDGKQIEILYWTQIPNPEILN